MRDLTGPRRPARNRPRRRQVGQALLELAVTAPILTVLLVGGLQFAYLGYANVTVDTAAREGARIASEKPNTTLSFASGGTSSYTCNANPATDSNPVCQAVANNAGLLDGASFALVRIDTNVAVAERLPRDIVRTTTTTAPCQNNNDAEFDGTTTPNVVVTANDSVDTQPTTSDSQGNFTLCLTLTRANGTSTPDTITVTRVAPCWDASHPSDSTQVSLTKSGGAVLFQTGSSTSSTYSHQFTLPDCPPVTTTTTTTTATTATTTSTSSSGGTTSSPPPVGGDPAADTCTTTPPAGSYVTVTVRYRASVFVPLVNNVLSDPGQSYHTVTAVVTMRVEPCTTL